MQLGDYEDDDPRMVNREAKLKKLVGGPPKGAPGRSLAEQQRHRDNELWENTLMQRGGAGARQEVQLDVEEDEETEKEHVVCRQITPPFLAGFKPSERAVTVVRDSTSDMATLARSDSFQALKLHLTARFSCHEPKVVDPLSLSFVYCWLPFVCFHSMPSGGQ